MTGLVALTGGTGFIGGHILKRLLRAGWRVRVLARRWDPALAQTEADVVQGSLEAPSSLEALVDSAEAVVHCAGAISARSRAEFVRTNRDGTALLAAAVTAQQRPPRLLLMSSLAAREPRLSSYAASKRMAEDAVRQVLNGKADFAIVRPPAVYGPGDRSTLPIFRQIRKGVLFVPAADARFSLLYVDDLAEIVAQLLQRPRWDGLVIEPDDGSGGYEWGDLARIASGHLDRPVRTVAVPRLALWLPAALSEIMGVAFRHAPMLTLGKLRELYHSDWVCRTSGAMPLPAGRPRVSFDNGFAATLAWYMQRKWL
jgi:nucleoside-diphosphate-sugar epimerase